MTEDGTGVELQEFQPYGIPVQRVRVQTERAAQALKKPCGTYTTIRTGWLSDLLSLEDVCSCLAEQLRPFLAPHFGKALCICGIGNRGVPADALGPETAGQIRPQMYEAASIQCSFSKIAVICPGIYGHTNLATETIVAGTAARMGASCVLTIDSCIAKEAKRLCSCIQLADTGMSSYRGISDLRQSSAGVPVVSVAVPTAIQMDALSPGDSGSCDILLTPSQIGDVINTAAQVIACAVTQVAYPALSYEDCRQCIRLFAHGLLP